MLISVESSQLGESSGNYSHLYTRKWHSNKYISYFSHQNARVPFGYAQLHIYIYQCVYIYIMATNVCLRAYIGELLIDALSSEFICV